MTARLNQVDRFYDRELKRIEREFERGLLSPEQYNEEMRELEREARDGEREAYEQDLADLQDEYFGGW